MFNDRCLHYVLNARGQAVPQPDALTWSQWFETSHEERVVEQTRIGDVEVSTVFLGLNHNFSSLGQPILWETMVFGGARDGDGDRYDSLASAKLGHSYFVQRERSTRPISLHLVE